MPFRIAGLPYAPFEPYFALNEEALRASAARIWTVENKPGYPCVVSLADAEPGERLLVANFAHLSENTPFQSSNAVYVREHAVQADLEPNEVPEMLSIRLLAARSFDTEHMLVAADVMEGADLAAGIERMFEDEAAAYIHIHLARPGCYAAKAIRWS